MFDRIQKIGTISGSNNLIINGDVVANGGWLQKLTVGLYKVGIGKAKCVFFQNATNKQFCESHGIVGRKARLLAGSGVNLEHHRFQELPRTG